MDKEENTTQYLACLPSGFTSGYNRGFVMMLVDRDSHQANTKIIITTGVTGGDFIAFLDECWGFAGNDALLPVPQFLQLVPLDISSLYAMQIVIEYHKRGISLIAGFPVDYPNPIISCWKSIIVPVNSFLRSQNEGRTYITEVENLLQKETARHNAEMQAVIKKED